MRPLRSTKAASVAAAAALVVAVFTVVVLADQDQDTGGQEPVTALRELAPESAPPVSDVDPITWVLGLESPEDFAAVQAGQAQLAASIADGSIAEGDISTADAMEAAVEALYDGLLSEGAFDPLQDEWRACMVLQGTPYESPTDLDDEIIAVGGALNDPVEADRLTRALENRDHCDSQVQPGVDALVEARLPAWVEEHAETIAAYRSLLGLG